MLLKLIVFCVVISLPFGFLMPEKVTPKTEHSKKDADFRRDHRELQTPKSIIANVDEDNDNEDEDADYEEAPAQPQDGKKPAEDEDDAEPKSGKKITTRGEINKDILGEGDADRVSKENGDQPNADSDANEEKNTPDSKDAKDEENDKNNKADGEDAKDVENDDEELENEGTNDGEGKKIGGQTATAMKMLQDKRKSKMEVIKTNNLDDGKKRITSVRKVKLPNLWSDIMVMNETLYSNTPNGLEVVTSSCYIYQLTRLASCDEFYDTNNTMGPITPKISLAKRSIPRVMMVNKNTHERKDEDWINVDVTPPYEI